MSPPSTEAVAHSTGWGLRHWLLRTKARLLRAGPCTAPRGPASGRPGGVFSFGHWWGASPMEDPLDQGQGSNLCLALGQFAPRRSPVRRPHKAAGVAVIVVGRDPGRPSPSPGPGPSGLSQALQATPSQNRCSLLRFPHSALIFPLSFILEELICTWLQMGCCYFHILIFPAVIQNALHYCRSV